MEEQFYQQLVHLATEASSARFLLAVSGGRDSVVLAHLFVSCGLQFDIAHCNFRLRKEESKKEMGFVQNLSFLTLQKVFVKEFETVSLQQNSGKSIEMVARELRYQWFEELGKDYDYIVTAHHANDNAETIFLNILRGTGLRGMCGIPQRNGKIIRPLLRFSASEIERYAQEKEIEFCVDSSNLSNEFLRNRIRHHIIPELEKINPNCIDIFSKNSLLFLQQNLFFDTIIDQYKEKLVKEEKGRITISIDSLRNIENQSLVLYEIINRYGFNNDNVYQILKSIDSNSGKRFISNTHILLKDRKRFIIEKKIDKIERNLIISNLEELEKQGFLIEIISNDSYFHPPANPKTIYVDSAKLFFPLTIRGWEKGDYFYPFGMKRRKRVSDFFTDLKIDLLEKERIRFLCSQGKIVWIINFRADDRFRIGSDTACYYKISTK